MPLEPAQFQLWIIPQNSQTTTSTTRHLQHAFADGETAAFERSQFVKYALNFSWILYEDTDYDQYNPMAGVYYIWGDDNYCVNFDPDFENSASSLRYVGPPDGYKYSTPRLSSPLLISPPA